MAKKDYLSRALDRLVTWLTNFFDNIDAIGATLGLTPAQITEVKARIENPLKWVPQWQSKGNCI